MELIPYYGYLVGLLELVDINGAVAMSRLEGTGGL